MKKFTIPCDFGGQTSPFEVYIGSPHPRKHPLHFQAAWLLRERGGVVPSDVMDSFQKLRGLATKNNVSFEELCVYALEAANKDKSKKGAASSKPSAAASPSTDGEMPQETVTADEVRAPEEAASPEPASVPQPAHRPKPVARPIRSESHSAPPIVTEPEVDHDAPSADDAATSEPAQAVTQPPEAPLMRTPKAPRPVSAVPVESSSPDAPAAASAEGAPPAAEEARAVARRGATLHPLTGIMMMAMSVLQAFANAGTGFLLAICTSTAGLFAAGLLTYVVERSLGGRGRIGAALRAMAVGFLMAIPVPGVGFVAGLAGMAMPMPRLPKWG